MACAAHHHCDQDWLPIHEEYCIKWNKISMALKMAKKQHWIDWLDNMTGGGVWIANKYLSTASRAVITHIPSLQALGVPPGSPTATSNDQKSDLLATTFFPPPPTSSTVPTNFQYPHLVPLLPTITDTTLASAITKFSPYKAPGADSICNIVFKKCSDIFSPHLLCLFKATMSLNTFYAPWRDFITVVLWKPGHPDYMLPKVYWPIVLLNTTYKLLSVIVADQLSYLLEVNHLLPHTHFSRHPGRSTTDFLHLLEAMIRNAWWNHKVVSVLFLDIKGAFPNSVTSCLIHNLCKRWILADITSFIQCALCLHYTQLKFDGYLSDWIPINNRIGQEDPLSIVLYIIYNTDVLDIPPANGCFISMQAFVDNMMLLAVGKTFGETHAMLKDMMEHPGGGYNWAGGHNSRFKTSKFALLDFSPNPHREWPNLTLCHGTIK